jgi:hypothetical protein
MSSAGGEELVIEIKYRIYTQMILTHNKSLPVDNASLYENKQHLQVIRRIKQKNKLLVHDTSFPASTSSKRH